jgi:hypothetical protein
MNILNELNWISDESYEDHRLKGVNKNSSACYITTRVVLLIAETESKMVSVVRTIGGRWGESSGTDRGECPWTSSYYDLPPPRSPPFLSNHLYLECLQNCSVCKSWAERKAPAVLEELLVGQQPSSDVVNDSHIAPSDYFIWTTVIFSSFLIHNTNLRLWSNCIMVVFWQSRTGLICFIVSRVWVTIDGVWVGNWIYWPDIVYDWQRGYSVHSV